MMTTEQMINAARSVRGTYLWQRDALARSQSSNPTDDRQQCIDKLTVDLLAIEVLMDGSGDYFEYLAGALTKELSQ